MSVGEKKHQTLKILKGFYDRGLIYHHIYNIS